MYNIQELKSKTKNLQEEFLIVKNKIKSNKINIKKLKNNLNLKNKEFKLLKKKNLSVIEKDEIVKKIIDKKNLIYNKIIDIKVENDANKIKCKNLLLDIEQLRNDINCQRKILKNEKKSLFNFFVRKIERPTIVGQTSSFTNDLSEVNSLNSLVFTNDLSEVNSLNSLVFTNDLSEVNSLNSLVFTNDLSEVNSLNSLENNSNFSSTKYNFDNNTKKNNTPCHSIL